MVNLLNINTALHFQIASDTYALVKPMDRELPLLTLPTVPDTFFYVSPFSSGVAMPLYRCAAIQIHQLPLMAWFDTPHCSPLKIFSLLSSVT